MAQGHKRVTVNATSCGFEPYLRKRNIYYIHFFALVSRQSAALSSANQYTMHTEFGGKLNTRLSLFATCGIQREADKKVSKGLFFIFRMMGKMYLKTNQKPPFARNGP